MLKRDRSMVLPTKKRLQIRYDKRTFKFYPESEFVSLSTVMGRLNFSVKVYEYCKQYLTGNYTNAQLVIKNGEAFLNIQCKLPDEQLTIDKRSAKVLGIDRGILNIVTCSDNSFVNSRHLRAVKSRYQYLKAKLQSIGTRSARRKLKRLVGRERRFVLDTNHVIAKKLVQKPYDMFAVEELHISKRKRNGRRFNKRLGTWSYGQLLTLLLYKAESLRKIVLQFDPRHTSQRCSRCGYVHKRNRKGLQFKCKQCGFELNADLNAARNIAQLGISELSRLSVNQPNVLHDGMADTSHGPSGQGS